MTGAIIQLIAKAKQNKYLISGKPDLNVFNGVYVKSNHYAKEFVEIESSSNVDFGNILTFILPKKGHYIYNTILKVKLPELTIPSGSTFIAWTNSIGHALIDKVEFSIGEYVIVEQDGLYMEIDDELSKMYNSGYNQLIGKYESNVLLNNNAEVEKYIYIPLKFWFNKNIQNALPLHALSNSFNSQTIKINITLKNFQDLVIYDGNIVPDIKDLSAVSLLIEYIFIEEQELKYNIFNPMQKEYIITQLQHVCKPVLTNSNEIINISLKSLNHPISEIFFVFVETESLNNNDYYNFGKRTVLPNEIPRPLPKTIKMLIEGKERYISQDESFYRLVLPYINHTNVSNKYIYTLPFSNKPENELCYSGSLNFSSIDSSNIIINMNSNIAECTLFIYAINYNIFFIENGLAGIRFSS